MTAAVTPAVGEPCGDAMAGAAYFDSEAHYESLAAAIHREVRRGGGPLLVTGDPAPDANLLARHLKCSHGRVTLIRCADSVGIANLAELCGERVGSESGPLDARGHILILDGAEKLDDEILEAICRGRRVPPDSRPPPIVLVGAGSLTPLLRSVSRREGWPAIAHFQFRRLCEREVGTFIQHRLNGAIRERAVFRWPVTDLIETYADGDPAVVASLTRGILSAAKKPAPKSLAEVAARLMSDEEEGGRDGEPDLAALDRSAAVPVSDRESDSRIGAAAASPATADIIADGRGDSETGQPSPRQLLAQDQTSSAASPTPQQQAATASPYQSLDRPPEPPRAEALSRGIGERDVPGALEAAGGRLSRPWRRVAARAAMGAANALVLGLIALYPIRIGDAELGWSALPSKIPAPAAVAAARPADAIAGVAEEGAGNPRAESQGSTEKPKMAEPSGGRMSDGAAAKPQGARPPAAPDAASPEPSSRAGENVGSDPAPLDATTTPLPAQPAPVTLPAQERREAAAVPNAFPGRGGAATRDAEMLLRRGDALLAAGDINAARSFFGRAAEAGDAVAAIRLGKTYDPVYLQRAGVHGTFADPAKAKLWYEKAAAAGDSEAQMRLLQLMMRYP